MIRDPAAVYRTVTVPDRLAQAGIDARQVQVIWMLNGFTERIGRFPDHVDLSADAWGDVLRIVHSTFPNARLCFLSSMHWQGWSTYVPDEEPYDFEQAFGVREVIARQMAGDPELNVDPAVASVAAPWVAWGPYLWCSGGEPRVDGLVMECADYDSEGSHLTDRGAAKFGTRLLHLWKSHPTCVPWSVIDGSWLAGRPAAVVRIGESTRVGGRSPSLVADDLPRIPNKTPCTLSVRHALPDSTGWLLLGDSLWPHGGLPFAGGLIRVEPFVFHPLPLDGDGHGRLVLEPIPDDPALHDADYYAQFVGHDPSRSSEPFSLSAGLHLRLGD